MAKIRNPFPADVRLPNSPSRRMFRRNPLKCWSAGRTFVKQKKLWSQPTRKSALPKPRSFPACRSPDWGGLESNALNSFYRCALRNGGRCTFSVTQPVFQGGALRSGLKLARANWQETAVSYQQTVQNALEQVSNSLIASQKNREFREQQELLTKAAQQTDPIFRGAL